MDRIGVAGVDFDPRRAAIELLADTKYCAVSKKPVMFP